ncbi:DUF4124 domain-containing protein [Massilia sp. Dwa41.01b]|uniref:DUF4124 domain-containing protein n=1 Tax=unclassified Massilia TaxID=2609279 RepID=UPI0016048B47|nr:MULTISPECIES: DUF4124 domain-containing protein [unclassified Massilia]QNA89318.1 DUF4124 domain-containing protein [Massilia sp. Dwa41.01b]QNB00217.1 DUF4124 domain-containing protein [Massilia sp. Se16.2.3]
MSSLPSLSPRLAALALFFCAGLAQAQFVWIAPNGTRHYSDQPPPPGTPASRILKSPRGAAPAQVMPPAEAGADAPAEKPAEKPVEKPKPPTLADRERDYVKRGKERAEAEKKEQDGAKKAAARVKHCEEVRSVSRLYDSGIRISEVGPDGEKRFISDAERAERKARADAAMSECR